MRREVYESHDRPVLPRKLSFFGFSTILPCLQVDGESLRRPRDLLGWRRESLVELEKNEGCTLTPNLAIFPGPSMYSVCSTLPSYSKTAVPLAS